MKELRKRFETEQDNLRSFITCSCPNIQCGCDNIYDGPSVNRASESGFIASRDDQDSYYNR